MGRLSETHYVTVRKTIFVCPRGLCVPVVIHHVVANHALALARLLPRLPEAVAGLASGWFVTVELAVRRWLGGEGDERGLFGAHRQKFSRHRRGSD